MYFALSVQRTMAGDCVSIWDMPTLSNESCGQSELKLLLKTTSFLTNFSWLSSTALNSYK